MPTVSFPLDYLQRLTQTPPARLEQQAFDYGLEATLQDGMLEVEVTAERPDLLAAEGFTRAINVYNGQPRAVPESLAASGYRVQVAPEVLALRPYIAALTVENVSLGAAGLESLIQFQEKVTQTFGRQRQKIAIGVYDLDQVEGDLHYVARPKAALSFVPLAGAASMSAQQILSEHPSGKLYARTLPESDRVPVLQDSVGQVLSMPPIINAAKIGEVTAATQTLLIDVTGISKKTVLEMANILAHNFLDAGGLVKTVEIQHPDGDYITPTLARQSVAFSAKFLNQTLGSAIAKSDLKKYLDRMDLKVTGTDVIWVPTYRTDIFSDTDIAGDLLVAIGIDNFEAEPTALKFHMGTADTLKQYVLKLSDLAQRMELMEVKSFVLTNPALLERFDYPFIQTDNAKSQLLSAARSTLQAGLLEILSHNISAPKPINIYETGEVIRLNADQTVLETVCWGFASLDAKASFAIAKSYVQTLLKTLQLPYELKQLEAVQYIAGRAAAVLVEGELAGHFGEIHPELLNYFSFPEPVCAGELDCRVLMAASH
ncbi:MAG: phenylalanine--tRNA ligase subunit beta [Leptolyngbya sp. SIO4C1]|nr:phenylalanine--tRNA ligase subunit beta [Leptolyngbya sp. SIO4C1]